jgi:hypothetical protein
MTTEAHEQKKMEVVYLNIGDIYDEESALRDLLPPLDEISREKLSALIEEAGAIRDPLSVAFFKDRNYLLDGYNRISIAKELIEKGLNFSTVPVVFYNIQDEVAGQIWMVENQIGKRNMGTLERIKMILQLEPKLQAEAKERQRAGGQGMDISTQAGKVRDILAEMAGKSSTIIRQAKRILDTKDKSLIAIADDVISINKADELAQLPEDIRAKKIAAIVKNVAKKQAKASEEPTEPEETGTDAEDDSQTIKITNRIFKPVSDLSYVSDTKDMIASIKYINDKPVVFSSVRIAGRDIHIDKYPETFTKHKARNIFSNNYDDRTYLTDDIYNETVHDITCLLDNIKTAKKISEDWRVKGRKEYIDQHPEIAEEQEAIKLAKKEQAKADKLALKKANNDKALAEEALKEKEAFATVHPSYYEFYLTLSKKDQKEVISSFYTDTHVSLLYSLNTYEYDKWLEKEKNKAERAKKKAARELEDKIGIPAMTAEEKEAISILRFTSTDSLAINDSYIATIEKDTTDGLVFGYGKSILREAREKLAKAKEEASAPVTAEAPTHTPAPKKVATKKKADKTPAESTDAPEPTAVATKNKRGSRQTGKK